MTKAVPVGMAEPQIARHPSCCQEVSEQYHWPGQLIENRLSQNERSHSMIGEAHTYWIVTKRPISQGKRLSIIPERISKRRINCILTINVCPELQTKLKAKWRKFMGSASYPFTSNPEGSGYTASGVPHREQVRSFSSALRTS